MSALAAERMVYGWFIFIKSTAIAKDKNIAKRKVANRYSSYTEYIWRMHQWLLASDWEVTAKTEDTWAKGE